MARTSMYITNVVVNLNDQDFVIHYRSKVIVRNKISLEKKIIVTPIGDVSRDF